MATSTPPRTEQRYVEFDEFIDYQLGKTRSNIKVTEVLTALAGAATLVLAYLLVFVVFDHWIVPGGFSFWPRLLMLAGVGLAASAWIVWKVAVPYFRRINALYAARTLEQADPSLRSNLLNLVDLRRAGRRISPQILSTLEKQTAVTLQRIDVDHAVDHRPLMRISYALLAVVVLSCVYVLFSPKKVSNSVWRALFPAANVAVSTRTEILDVKPGDTEVLAKSSLEVTADLRGEIPPQVTLLYSTADGKYVDEPVEMRETDEGLRRYRGVIAGDNGRGILQDLTYRIHAGDAESSVYKVAVLQPPSAKVEEVGYAYPDYMQLEPRTQPAAAIDAWEGTTVTLTAGSNMPVTSAWVVFTDDPDPHGPGEEIPMTVKDGTKLSAQWKLAFRPNGTYPHFYHIQCRNENGDRDPDPTVHNITIRPDKPPEVELLDPTGDLELPANSIVPLSIVARDPDFRLRYLTLRIEKGGEELRPEEIFEGLRKSLATTYEWKLEPLNLQPGDVITYWLEARDNKQPLGNRKTTPKLNIRITEPVSEEKVQEQLAADKQRQEELLEEARQQGNEEGVDSDDAPDSGSDDPQQQPADAQPDQAGDQPEQQTGDPQQGRGAGQSQSADSQTGDSAGDEGDEGDGRQQPLNPDDATDDAETLKRIYDRIQREEQRRQEQEEQASDGEPGDDGAPQDGDSQGRDPSDPGDGGDSSESDGDSPRDGRDPRDQDPQGRSPDPSKSDPMKPDEAGDEPGRSDGSKTDDTDKGSPEKGSGEPGQPTEDDPSGKSMGESDQPGQKPEQRSPEDGRSPDKPGEADPQSPRDARDPQKGDQDQNAQDAQKPLDGEKRPADPSDDGVKQKADGDETGTGRPQDDPEADPTRAKNDIEREQGADPATRPSDQKPEDVDPQKQDAAKSDENRDPKSGEPASKTPPDADPKRGGEPQPSSPDDATRERPVPKTDKQPDSAGDQAADGRQEGGGAEKSDGGQAGEKGGGPDQGQSGGDPDASDEKGMPGDGQSGGKPEEGGQPGDQQGQGGQSDGDKPAGDEQTGGGEGAGQSGEKSDSSEKGGGDQGGQSGEAGDQPGDSQGDGASSGQPSREGGGATRGGPQAADGNDAGDGGGDGGGAPHADDPNPDHAKKAADMVLKRLQNELDRGEVDKELLEELGWTEHDMKRFAERLQKQLHESSAPDESPESIARRRQFEETLKNLDLESGSTARRDSQAPKRSIDSIGPRNLPTPAEYREAAEAYLRNLSKQGTERPASSQRRDR